MFEKKLSKDKIWRPDIEYFIRLLHEFQTFRTDIKTGNQGREARTLNTTVTSSWPRARAAIVQIQ